MAATSRRFTLLEKPTYKVDLEYNEQFAILHLPLVAKFDRDVYWDMVNTIEDIAGFLHDMHYTHLWTAIEPENKPTNKLMSRLGFELQGEGEGMNVYMKEIT